MSNFVGRLILCAVTGFCVLPSAMADAQFQNGTYFGSVQMDGQSTYIPTRLDAFAIQPSQTAFPHLETILKISLGGFNGIEYATYHFKSVAYDYTQAVLTLDDPSLDVSAVLQVSNTDSAVILDGMLMSRASLNSGHVHLEMSTDGTPISLPTTVGPLPSLSGEYDGTCNGKKSALQIETGREAKVDILSKGDLDRYVVSGRIGDSKICLNSQGICSKRFFNRGIYQVFSGQLQLSGPQSNLNCQVAGNALACTQWMVDHSESCTLTKSGSAPSDLPQVNPQRFHLPTTPAQMAALPAPNQPTNADLISALTGDFYGILHHERSDAYQLVKVRVLASNSSEISGNPNEVSISSTLGILFGDSWTSQSVQSQAFDRRSFNLVPYFTLASDMTDGFFVISQWKQGYLSGDWISNAYGRVGTIELVKGQQPSLPSSLARVPIAEGTFVGPTNSGAPDQKNWKLTLSLFALESSANRSTAQLSGEYYDPIASSMPSVGFDSGAYDFYSGAFSLLRVIDPNIVMNTGQVLSSKQLSLLWPSSPVVGVSMLGYLPWTFDLAGGP